MQYALWPILLVFLTLVPQIQSSFGPQLLAWGTAAVVQIVVVAYYAALYEQYNNTRYMERELRPEVQSLLGKHSFWRYEVWLKDRRGLHPLWWESWPLGLSILALILAIVARFRGSVADYFGLLVNAAVASLAASLFRKATKIRQEFFPPPNG